MVKTSGGKNKVVVVGLGYVGLPLALRAQDKKYVVTGIDIDKQQLLSIHNSYPDLRCTTSFDAVGQADVIVICVPTPINSDHKPDLSPVINACTSVARRIKPHALLILESTVNPGVSDEVVIPILEDNTGLKVGTGLFYAHCPERINPKDKHWNLTNINRIVGANDETSRTLACEFYRSLIDAEVMATKNIKEAEAAKVVENSFRDLNIAFVNELAMSFDKLGIDLVNVIEAASTKPFSFLAHWPGIGVGGHCIPVDPYYLIEYASMHGFEHRLMKLARQINEEMPDYALQHLKRMLTNTGNRLEDTSVGILGFAYKPDIDDSRESPTIKLLDLLAQSNANVTVIDPNISPDTARREYLAHSRNTDSKLANKLAFTSEVNDWQRMDALVYVTAHTAFKAITPRDIISHSVKVFIDGRNVFTPSDFGGSTVQYYGIGRGYSYADI